MHGDFLYSEDIDSYLNWAPGTATRLARRRKLPHYVLPDGSIRFRLEEVQALVRHIQTERTLGVVNA
jgi:hypothetical protein